MLVAKKQLVLPELNALVAEAVRSLSKLDANRLEELALSCQELNRDMTPAKQQALACEARAAKRDMAALAQMLKGTGANAAVMKRLRELRTCRMEYTIIPEAPAMGEKELHGVH